MSNEGKKVRAHYRGTLDDGTQFDSSYDRGEPLEFTCCAHQMIPGFDAAVKDMEVGEKKTVHIPCAEAYGERREDLIMFFPAAQVPNLSLIHISLKDNNCAISIDMAKGTPWAQCFATFVPDCFSPEQSLRFHAQIMAHISAQTNLNHAQATEVHAASDIRPALDQDRFACIHTIENARMFAHDLNLIEALKRAGVLMASLTWNAAGPLASGPDTHAGLTDLGRQAIAEMERLSLIHISLLTNGTQIPSHPSATT